MSMLDKLIPVRRDFDMEGYHRRYHLRNTAENYKRLQKRLARRLSRRCAREYISQELQPVDWRERYAHGPGGAFLGDEGDAYRVWLWRAFFIWLEDY